MNSFFCYCVFVLLLATQKGYDKIDAKKVNYVKTDKK